MKKIALLSLSALLFSACSGGGGGGGGGGRFFSSQRTVFLPFAQYGQRATTMLNGDVLVTGGFDKNNFPLDEAYQYDAILQRVFDVDPSSINNDLVEPRALHTQTLIEGFGGPFAPQGSLLMTGGNTGFGISFTAEVYDPFLDDLRQVGDLTIARENHSATEIRNSGTGLDGFVLIVGGRGTSGILNSSEIFNPFTGTFVLLSSRLTIAREGHTATLLSNGHVLITGGNTNSGVTDRGEIFDPFTQSFFLVPNQMSEKRTFHTATYLNNKTQTIFSDDAVLIAGGLDDFGFALDNADFFNIQTARFEPVFSVMQEPVFAHAATELPNSIASDVAITGGFTNFNFANPLNSNPTEQIEIFNYNFTGGRPDGFFLRTTDLLERRAIHTENHIRFGTLLMLGGIDGFGTAHDTGEEFDF